MARILHTADWHVGRDVLRCDRTEDFEDVLAEIVVRAEGVRPDLILHCGDVFDGPRPSTDDMQLALGALGRLSQIAPTVVLAGNHDSGQLFGVFSMLRGESERLRFVDRARHPRDGGIIDIPTQDGERIRIAPVPFIHANRQVDFFADPQRFMGTYAERMALINQAMADGLQDGYDPTRDVLIYAAHLYVTGAHLAHSERQLHVTDVYAAQNETLPAVDYVALGHIHKPQELPGTVTGRYVGSPLQMDFGEQGETKSLALVELRPSRPPQVQLLELDAGRPLRALRGTLEQIAAEADDVGAAIVKVVVETDEPLEDLADQVRALLPQATLADVQQAVANRKLETLTAAALDEQADQGVVELFAEYLAEHGSPGAPAQRVHELFEVLHEHQDAEGPLSAHVPDAAELLAAELPAAPTPVLGDLEPEANVIEELT